MSARSVSATTSYDAVLVRAGGEDRAVGAGGQDDSGRGLHLPGLEREPADGGRLGLLPLGHPGGLGGLVVLQVLLQGGGLGGLLPLGLGELGGERGLVGGKLLLRGGDVGGRWISSRGRIRATSVSRRPIDSARRTWSAWISANSLMQEFTSSPDAGRLRMRRNSSSTSFLSSGMVLTSLATSLLGSPMASLMVGPLTRAMTGPSWRPLDRSHSQALSRAGRPKVVRKPLGSSTSESGNSAARVPVGTPGNFETAPVARLTASYSTSAGSLGGRSRANS